MRLGWLMIVLGLCVAGASCARAPAPAARATPPRVVALGPALSIIMRDLGIESLIVGRHSVDTRLGVLPAVGDQAGIDLEALQRVRPSHVYMQWGLRDPPEALAVMAREGGWTLVNLPLLTLDDIDQAVDRLARDLGAEPTGRGVRPRLDALHRDRASAGRVLLLHTALPPAALGPGSYHHELLQRLGATPALSEGKPYMTLDAEDVLRLRPDVIILLQPRDRDQPGPDLEVGFQAVKPRLGKLADLDVPAIHRGRVAVITSPDVLVPGTNLVEVAGLIAKALDSWTSAEPSR